MNTRDEIIDALSGKRGDVAPPAIFTQTGTVPQMEACGSFFDTACFDLDSMVNLSLQPNRMFGFATAKVPFCITIESERLGAELSMGENSAQPAVTSSPFFSDEVPDFPGIMSPEEFVSGGRCKVVCDASARIRKENENIFTIAGCADPFSVSYLLTGVDNFLMGLLMGPEKCKSWVYGLEPLMTEYAKVLSENADDVQIIAEASSEIMPPEYFDEFVGVPVRKMISAVKGFSTIHSCGETAEVRDQLALLGEDGLSLQIDDSAEEVYEALSGKVCLMGGIPAVDMMLRGTPADIVASARRCSDIGFGLITPECGVPPFTPNENLEALAHYREL